MKFKVLPWLFHCLLRLLVYTMAAFSQVLKTDWQFDVTMVWPAAHTYHVTFPCPVANAPILTL